MLPHHWKLLIAALIIISAISSKTLADNASVSSFSSSALSVASGEPVSFSWFTSNSGGAKLLLPCTPGIRYKTQANKVLSCGTKLDFLVNDSAIFMITNSYGSAVYVRPALIPLNADGTENAAGKKEIKVEVAADPSPIRELTAATSTVPSGSAFALSWKAPEIEKVNVEIACNADVVVTVPTDIRPQIPCETFIFSSDLPGSGSKSFTLANLVKEKRQVKFKVFPKIAGTSNYDGTHVKSVEVEVGPAPETKDPRIISFSAPGQAVKNGEKALIAWQVVDGAAVNFRLSCTSGIAATSSLTSTSTLPCGEDNFLFSANQKLSGFFTLGFQNSSDEERRVSLTLVPAIGAGAEYDGRRMLAKTIAVAGKNSASVQTSVVAAPKVISQAALSLQISKELYYGMRQDKEVVMLQKILAAEKLFSGPMEGNFGSMTLSSVKEFQKKYGIRQTGYVGPMTIKKLNEVANAKGVR